LETGNSCAIIGLSVIDTGSSGFPATGNSWAISGLETGSSCGSFGGP
jgi:hypothetical protein